MADETDTTSEVGDAIRELAHVVRPEDEIEGIALQVDDLWNRVQAQREATTATETDTTSDVARVLGEHRIECTGLEGVTCRGCRERGWMSRHAFERHQADALAEAGLLREETGSAEPCDSEVWSMDYYRDGQVDPYWIRCNTLGPHVEHEDANTGLTWTTDYPQEAQIATQEPAEQPAAGSAGRGASGGLDGAPVDAWPFQRGAVLEWPEDPQTVIDALEDAPVGVHVSDRFSNPWRRFPKGWAAPKSTSDGSNAPSSYLAGRAPITVTALTDTEITP